MQEVLQTVFPSRDLPSALISRVLSPPPIGAGCCFHSYSWGFSSLAFTHRDACSPQNRRRSLDAARDGSAFCEDQLWAAKRFLPFLRPSPDWHVSHMWHRRRRKRGEAWLPDEQNLQTDGHLDARLPHLILIVALRQHLSLRCFLFRVLNRIRERKPHMGWAEYRL